MNHVTGLITSQIDTAPKLVAYISNIENRLITSQIDTAPKHNSLRSVIPEV